MMDLILWRHAEAVPERIDQNDLERALTPKGERQAQRMGEWLNQRLAHSTRVLASPALRCQQTANSLGRAFKTVEGLAPGCDPQSLLQLVRWPDANEPVLVVGHQPTLGQVAALLVADIHASFAIKKAGVWWLRSRDREELAKVVVQAVQSPDLL